MQPAKAGAAVLACTKSNALPTRSLFPIAIALLLLFTI